MDETHRRRENVYLEAAILLVTRDGHVFRPDRLRLVCIRDNIVAENETIPLSSCSVLPEVARRFESKAFPSCTTGNVDRLDSCCGCTTHRIEEARGGVVGRIPSDLGRAEVANNNDQQPVTRNKEDLRV